MKRTHFLTMGLLGLLLSVCSVRAEIIDETEDDNQYYAISQVLDAHFTLEYQYDIDTLKFGSTFTKTNTSLSIPHVTIEATGDGTIDFYAFSGSAGQLAIIDVDHSNNPNMMIHIWQAGLGSYGGEIIAIAGSIGSANLQFDTGSSLGTDRFVQFELPATDTYYIGVSQIGSVPFQWTPTYYQRVGIPAGINYSLHVSRGYYSTCPYSDITGDCLVSIEDLSVVADQWLTGYDLSDFAVMASQWQTDGKPNDPANLLWVDVNEPGFTGQISKFEITNAQYCQYLNAAMLDGLIQIDANRVFHVDDNAHTQPYCETYDVEPNSQIYYSGGFFYVRTRESFDMSDHPVVEVSAYGADAFCAYYGYVLPSEEQWQAVADYDGSFVYGCGPTISQLIANYEESVYANPLGFSDPPFTTPVGYYPAHGYGAYDMAGNVREWTGTNVAGNRIARGGGWDDVKTNCEVTTQHSSYTPNETNNYLGFRVCRSSP